MTQVSAAAEVSTGPPTTDRAATPVYDYARYSHLAGPVTEPAADRPYRVEYRSLLSRTDKRIRLWVMMLLAPLAELALLVWMLLPQNWSQRPFDPRTWLRVMDKVVLGTIVLIETFRLLQIVSNVHGTLFARDPVPVRPETGTRVAFVTACVPGKEPIAMVRTTLAAARRIRHSGTVDVWLLDEGDQPEMRALCEELGVRHFSRKGVERWNQRKGHFRARTKHGNYNSWLDAHGADYDFLACVDTDHVPHGNFLERTLGYFRDPDIAFVVGPQVYGNYEALVTKAAESQQFLFHAVVQRAGNKYSSPMLVGTNNVLRVEALRQIGGFHDSITEDMATGMVMHTKRNPVTRRTWKSVYTPDVLAVGEGPSSWTDFFAQQLRWSRGTYETLLKQFWWRMFRLSPGRLFNYLLMLTFYPMSGISCIFGGISSVLYLVFGASGVSVSTSTWMMLFSDAVLLQIGLYSVNRKHNVSPHEKEGSTGIGGIAMGVLATPVYASSLIAAVLRMPGHFKVTPKGDSASPDRLWTFRIHLLWALVFGGALAASFVTGNAYPAMRIWAGIALVSSLLPLVIWRAEVVRVRRTTSTTSTTSTAVHMSRGDTP
ncbi:glycosyltransferase family 2 protein [Streptacidiphilus sp. EB103A]|uniref:glycosyltransferase family 2 protein n=1 Tax=Streptacidiphilus sp. EB103A TaxID=3156275 RepID=UPI003519C8CA